jgi:hypothetical protein
MATKTKRKAKTKPPTVKAVPGTGDYVVAIIDRDGVRVEDVWSAETVDEAATFADEFNRLESKKPKGQIAFVDRFNLCTAKKARTVRKAVAR